jgi:hypothetical protein
MLLRRAPLLFLRWLRPRQRELGELGEALAVRHLRAAGWRIEGRRVATPFCEIDLVARCGTIHACVEVKTGRCEARPARDPFQRSWRPGVHLDARTLRRQWRAARWIAAMGCGTGTDGQGAPGTGPRVDLVEVLIARSGSRVWVRHHERLERPL